MEEKLKKVTTERAPVAGGPASGVTPRQQAAQNVLQRGMVGGHNVRDLTELLQLAQRGSAAQTPAPGTGAGAAAAAGVLTAIDEDEEGAQEAAVPGDFDYYTEEEEEDVN